MRIFAISDLHIDYHQNLGWLKGTSQYDYKEDILILAGDISDRMSRLTVCFDVLAKCFSKVLFVPGNHDLWVRLCPQSTSFDKFNDVMALAHEHGIQTHALTLHNTTIVPLLSWYDYSFGEPSGLLLKKWMDFKACSWPEGETPQSINAYFTKQNPCQVSASTERVITFSHFLPRIDLIPKRVPERFHFINPVLGSSKIEAQLRRLGSKLHVYGHSHIARDITLEGVRYVNSALGTPKERRYTSEGFCYLTDV